MDVPPSSEPAGNVVAGALGALNALLLSMQDYDEFLAEVARRARGRGGHSPCLVRDHHPVRR